MRSPYRFGTKRVPLSTRYPVALVRRPKTHTYKHTHSLSEKRSNTSITLCLFTCPPVSCASNIQFQDTVDRVVARCNGNQHHQLVLAFVHLATQELLSAAIISSQRLTNSDHFPGLALAVSNSVSKSSSRAAVAK